MYLIKLGYYICLFLPPTPRSLLPLLLSLPSLYSSFLLPPTPPPPFLLLLPVLLKSSEYRQRTNKKTTACSNIHVFYIGFYLTARNMNLLCFHFFESTFSSSFSGIIFLHVPSHSLFLAVSLPSIFQFSSLAQTENYHVMFAVYFVRHLI